MPRPFAPPLNASALALAAALLATSLVAPAAHAQDDRETARVLYENGAALYEEGQYEKAITAWEEAWRLSKEPALLYNIANAWERLGALDKALDKLNDYRIYAPEDEREAIARRMRVLEQRIADQAAAPPPTTPSQPVVEPAPPAPAPRAAHPRRTAGIALLAVGVGSAGAASGLYGAAAGATTKAQSGCVDTGSGWLCLGAGADDAARGRTLAAAGHATWGITGAVIAAGAALIATDKPTRVVLLPTPRPDGAGLTLVVSL